MTHDEMFNLLRGMCTALNVRMNAADFTSTVEVWQELFGEFPVDLMKQARVAVLASHGYNTLPPPAKFLDALNTMRTAHEPSALAAWGEVVQAIADHGYVDEAGALASMSPRTAYVVERMGWQELCVTPADATSVIRGQFIKLYDACKQHTPDLKALGSAGSRQEIGKGEAWQIMRQIDTDLQALEPAGGDGPESVGEGQE